MSPSDIEDAPKISLGGESWPIPQLAAKQNKVIDPLIIRLLPIFAMWATDRAQALAKLGEQEYDSLLEIALHAVRRARPETKREEFLDLPITLPELIAAFPVIAEQTGIFKRGEPGEAQAAGSRPTGTESSPMSAT